MEVIGELASNDPSQRVSSLVPLTDATKLPFDDWQGPNAFETPNPCPGSPPGEGVVLAVDNTIGVAVTTCLL